jgi:hypothetical protein
MPALAIAVCANHDARTTTGDMIAAPMTAIRAMIRIHHVTTNTRRRAFLPPAPVTAEFLVVRSRFEQCAAVLTALNVTHCRSRIAVSHPVS